MGKSGGRASRPEGTSSKAPREAAVNLVCQEGTGPDLGRKQGREVKTPSCRDS